MKKFLLLLTPTALLALPFLVYGDTSAYKPLIQLPISTGGATGWQGYIDLLYATAISLAALLAVIKIVIAGAKYMFSDVITNKSEAKKDIQGALLGLLLILGAVILLNLINPQLTNTTINIDRIQPTPSVPPVPPVAAVPPTPGSNPAAVPATPKAKPAPVPGGNKPSPSARCGTVDETRVTRTGSTEITNMAICDGNTAAEYRSTCTSSGGTVTGITSTQVICTKRI